MTALTDQQMLDKYKEAEASVLAGKAYYWGERRFFAQDLPAIQKGRQEYELKVQLAARKAAGGPKLNQMRATFSDDSWDWPRR
jgi:hypothetical protein